MHALVVRQPLVLVVGPAGPGRRAALTILAGPAAGGTMIDLGALWMAVDPPADRPRTVRLNGAPSAVGRRGWEAIAGAIGAVAAPPAVVLVDTFRGLSDALGDAGAAETVSALVVPGRTVVLVLDDLAEAVPFGETAARHGVVVSVDGQAIRDVRPVAAGQAPPAGTVPAPREADDDPPTDRRWRWWRRAEATPPLAVEVGVAVVDTAGAPVTPPLTPGGYYLIQVAMRAAGASSGADGSGAWVQVSAATGTVPVPPGPHPMFVPPSGPAWTCPCPPDGPHSCQPLERSERLELPFVAPRRTDVHQVHVAVWHDGSVVHRTALELPVNLPGDPRD